VKHDQTINGREEKIKKRKGEEKKERIPNHIYP
jgi:hypothetical protein